MKQDNEYIKELCKLTSRITRVVLNNVKVVDDEIVDIKESIKQFNRIITHLLYA